MKYAFFDNAGRIVSTHNDDTARDLPEGAVALSDEQWGNRCNLRLRSGEIVTAEPEVSAEDLAVSARRERTRLLIKNVDSINPLRWESMEESEKDRLRKYREDLLKVPEQEGFPFNIKWPVL